MVQVGHVGVQCGARGAVHSRLVAVQLLNKSEQLCCRPARRGRRSGRPVPEQGEQADEADEVPRRVLRQGGPDPSELGRDEALDRQAGHGAAGRGGRRAHRLHLRPVGRPENCGSPQTANQLDRVPGEEHQPVLQGAVVPWVQAAPAPRRDPRPGGGVGWWGRAGRLRPSPLCSAGMLWGCLRGSTPLRAGAGPSIVPAWMELGRRCREPDRADAAGPLPVPRSLPHLPPPPTHTPRSCGRCW